MFDLLEEDLVTKAAQPIPPTPQLQNPLAEPVVISMPEKFRKGAKKSAALPAAIVGGTLLILASIGGVVFFLIGKQPQQQEEVVPPITAQPEIASTSPITVPPLDSNQSSTASVLEGQSNTLVSSTDSVASDVSTSSSVTVIPPQVSTSSLVQPPPLIPDGTHDATTVGHDSDTDLLTDTEERLYGTDPEKPDTDEDGFLDGTELIGGFDPTKASGAKIATSALVNAYTNTDFRYSFIYPSSWVASGANQQNREVLVSAATGEFFSFTIRDNPDQLSPLAWATTGPDADLGAGAFSSTTAGDLASATSKDGQTVIFKLPDTQESGHHILVARYNLNTKNEINFLSTFKMMIKSLFVIKTGG